MKKILLIILYFTSLSVIAQQRSITIKAQGQTITASLDDDNGDRALVLNSSKKLLKTDKLVTYNSNSKEFKDWKRSFKIYDATDAEIATLKTGLKENYKEISLKDVFAKLKKDQDYSLYTIALPKDPNRAAVARVRRILMCTIRVK